jgi:glycosyltransferase involved in cell wall biosynthesis
LKVLEEFPSVSIIVVVLNMANMIGVCLSSLMSLDYPKNRYEIIVIDGGSVDDTVKVCNDFGVQCIIEKKRGRGLARNVGIKKAKGEIIAFIDADCSAQKNWLSVHVSHHSDKTIGAVTGSVTNPYLSFSTQPAILMHYENFAEFDQSLKTRSMYHAPTCNTSYRRVVLAKVGLFDEQLDAYEDFVLSKKITNLGYKILFEPKAKVLHFGIIPNLNVVSYLARERKMGEAHFCAQTVNKTILGHLPTNKYVVLLFFPSLAMSRLAREAYKLLRVRRKASDLLIIRYLVYGSATWALSYVRGSFCLKRAKKESQ